MQIMIYVINVLSNYKLIRIMRKIILKIKVISFKYQIKLIKILDISMSHVIIVKLNQYGESGFNVLLVRILMSVKVIILFIFLDCYDKNLQLP